MDRIDLGTDKKTGMAAFALTMVAIFLAWGGSPGTGADLEGRLQL